MNDNLSRLVSIVEEFQSIRRASAHCIMAHLGHVAYPGEDKGAFQALIDLAIEQGLIQSNSTSRGTFLFV